MRTLQEVIVEFQALFKTISDQWHWKPENDTRFQSHHILCHIQKVVGALAAKIERVDHGVLSLQDIREDMKEVCGKIIINTFQLARVFGIPAYELEQWMLDFYSKDGASKSNVIRMV